MKQRIILLLDMDAFFAMIEERENPHFQGKPVVVGADPKEGRGRGVVSTANYEARTYGIHSALPISEAWRLCPKAVFLPVDGALYSKTSSSIMEILRGYAPLVEQVSLDEAYLDISAAGDFTEAEKIAQKIRAEIFKKERLPASCGIAPNKMVAKIACEKAKPNGVMVVKPKEAESFLDPLGIREIPGVGPKTAASLARLSCSQLSLAKDLRVRDVKKISRSKLREILGKHGETLYKRLRGIDDAEVVADEMIKSVGKEHTFEKDTRDAEEIFPVFRSLVSEIARELQKEQFSFATITVVCRFQGFETHTKSKTFREVSTDWDLFEKEAMQLLLRFLTENLKPVRLIGVRCKVASQNPE